MNFSIKLAPTTVSRPTYTVPDYLPSSLKQIQVGHFWNQGFEGQDTTIAVLDTGCDSTHRDLKSRIIGGRNFTNDDNGNPDKYSDYNGHGTHVAGIIAASAYDGGIVGVAPKSNLLILKVLDKNGSGSYSGLISAIYYAIAQNVDIITMSLGGPSHYPLLRRAIQDAINADICVICAASNEGDGRADTNEYAYPAYYPEVISVGAATNDFTTARFSNSNDQIDLVAPGESILSTYLGNRYSYMSGTSMATPHVAGALALLINWGYALFGRHLTEYELYAQLLRHCVSMGQPPSSQGSGILYLSAVDILNNTIKLT